MTETATQNADASPKSTSSNSKPFEADVARLLELVVHSIYSDRDIFLRELISNAVDACEKLRFERTTGAVENDSAFRIVITPSKEKGALEIADNGIGMNSADLEKSLGVIANSGTRAFLEQMEANSGKAESLIGRFGIGFYSSFMVADRVDVFTRRAGDTQGWRWSSDGKGTYEITQSDAAPDHGARIVLHLKEDARDYLESDKLEQIVRQHSAGAPVPIDLVGEDGAEQRIGEGAGLWTRPKSEVTPEQYADFYRRLSGNFDAPALTIHWRAEGRHEFDALAFIPSARPFDLFNPNREGHGKLYVRRVLVTDKAELLPPWLRFVAALVDSADIPLNVSRELVQKSPVLAAIRKALVNRIVQELTKFAGAEESEQREKYASFWKNFGAVIKEGLYEDPERRDALFGLARFTTTKAPAGDRTLKDYVANLKTNQTAIYYLTGTDAETLAASPHLEAFRARDIEVLLLSDPVDSFWASNALGFDGKPFKSVAQGALDIDAIPAPEGATPPEKRETSADDAALIAQLKTALEQQSSDVRASDRLKESAACLVAGEHGVDRTLARILGEAGKDMAAKPILEINLDHPLVRALSARRKEPKAFDDYAQALFGLARLAEGELPDNPAALARILSHLAASGGAHAS
jgi:molecular chaperone HtpG